MTVADSIRNTSIFIFGVMAAITGLLAWQNHTDLEKSNATLGEGRVTTGETVEALPLIPVEPETFAQNAPVIVHVAYSPESIALSGVVNAQPLAEALILASEQLITGGYVSDEFNLISGAELAIVQLEISGEVLDEEDRYRVVSKYLSLGVNVIDQLIIRGSDRTIFEVIRDTPELGQVFDFFEAAGIEGDISSESQTFTIFAPTNNAVEALDIAALQEFAELVQLNEILQFHVIAEVWNATDLVDGSLLITLQGETLSVDRTEEGVLSIGGGIILSSDIEATNGVIHVIDQVLIPGTIQTEIELNQIVVFDPVLFAVGSPFLADSSIPILEEIATILINNSEGNLEVQGHTDTDGSEEINLSLSQSRADTVRDFLISEGVEPERVIAVGFGETRLKVDPEETAEDRAKNRRIEFRVN